MAVLLIQPAGMKCQAHFNAAFYHSQYLSLSSRDAARARLGMLPGGWGRPSAWRAWAAMEQGCVGTSLALYFWSQERAA